jgi:predicted AlkP superfamily pyrophosphatase or phosphodiesterase
MHKTVVINVVGLTPALLESGHMPRLAAFARDGSQTTIGPVIPAVTTTVQSTYLTGEWPSEHGVVGNGWYFRDECEVKFWKQSNKLVQRPKIWDRAKEIDPGFTCANLFWWYNMYSAADYSVTPRPMYPADGRKMPDIYTHPESLREELQRELGQFPLFQFWGPATSIKATQWIAESAIRVDQRFNPTLTLIYLPHLDYGLQKLGPDVDAVGQDLREVDEVCGKLIDHFKLKGTRTLILSEYGIGAVSKPVHLNRVLREAGLLAVREELGRELLDPGASAAFAVADHQVAYVYVNDLSKLERVKKLVEQTPGVAEVLDEGGKKRLHLDHPRSGELVALAERNAWFTYYYWLNDMKMPDFARTVDIHRKPGYDPAELFIDPELGAPKAKIAWALLKRKMGMRALLEVIPARGEMVRGSHGLAPASASEGPILLSDQKQLTPGATIEATEVCNVILRHLTQD